MSETKFRAELIPNEEADPTLSYVAKVCLVEPSNLPEPWNQAKCDPLMVAVAHLKDGRWEWAAYDEIGAKDAIGACLVDNDVPIGEWRFVRVLEAAE